MYNKNVRKVCEINMIIRIKLHDKEITPPASLEVGNWIDLRSAEDVSLKAGEFAKLSLGISMELPSGYEAILAPRSSSFKLGFIVTNSIGIIDNSYNGNNDIWQLPIYAFKDFNIKKNDRICQFRIQKTMPNISFEIVDSLGNTDRGGFGSTGID